MALWKSMGKIHSNTCSYAQIPAYVYTSRWTDKIVQPMDIQQKSISLKDFLGKDLDMSDSGKFILCILYKNNYFLLVLIPDAKAFMDRFTEDWDPYLFRQLSKTKYYILYIYAF
jgi:hypothetical protein